MASRDYISAPVSDALQLPAIIGGLAADLQALREGKITNNDAIARSVLAKQIFNGVRLVLSTSKLLDGQLKPAAITTQDGENIGEPA